MQTDQISFHMPQPPEDHSAPQITSANAAPLDIVFIDGFRGETIIGIHHDELHARQPVRIDLRIGVPRPRACDTDQIDDTIDYGKVREALHRMLDNHRFQLLERFAEAIASLVIQDFGAHWVRVEVSKPAKFDDVDGVGVIIERRRPPANRSRPQDAEVLSLLGSGMVPSDRKR